MSTYQFINKENATIRANANKGKVQIGADKAQAGKKLNIKEISTNRVPLGGKKVVNNSNNNSKQNSKSLSVLGGALGDSFSFGDSGLKKKVYVEKDEQQQLVQHTLKRKPSVKKRKLRRSNEQESPLKSQDPKVLDEFYDSLSHYGSDEEKLESFNFDLESVPSDSEKSLKYVPDNYTPLTESDINFFQTKHEVPSKKTPLREVDDALNKYVSFDEIPVIELKQVEDHISASGEGSDSLEDDLMKKNLDFEFQRNFVKLDNNKIPDLHFDSTLCSTRSPKRKFSEANDEVSYEDLESLVT